MTIVSSLAPINRSVAHHLYKRVTQKGQPAAIDLLPAETSTQSSTIAIAHVQRTP
jgi:hypothetical protein